MSRKIDIFDSTLRDGAQGEGITFSVDDKLKITKILDNLGVKFIEAGNPGSNPKDLEFFEKASKLQLNNSELCAFGATRRRGIKAVDDENVKSLLKANTKTVVIFGKSSTLHVTEIIKATLQENLEMITDTLAFFKQKGKKVIYDAEHFFDGYKLNDEYAIKTLKAAVDAGAEVLSLCDTNGGSFPDEIAEVTAKVCALFKEVTIGIHCHNDQSLAVANSLAAVNSGANHVQGTFLGIGERCGNAQLSTLISILQVKMGYECIHNDMLANLTPYCIEMAEITNIKLPDNTPFVGHSAFAHKGGMHIDGVNKLSSSFEHTNPENVGNQRHFLMSEVAGRRAILAKINLIAPNLEKDDAQTIEILKVLKEKEHKGYQYEAATASFELLVMQVLGKYKPFFELDYYKTQEENVAGENQYINSTAVVKIQVKGQSEIGAGEGNGPVDALDKALRRVLEVFYPSLSSTELIDYKVRVISGAEGAEAKVRVLIDTTDGHEMWTTVGVSTDIINASFQALVDSLEYKLWLDK